jgi:hypothetical protein
VEIGQYHGNVPDWRRTTQTRQGELYGIELEVEHHADRQAVADALDAFDPGEHPVPAVERDGSLDPVRGVEIICPPLPKRELADEAGYIGRMMRLLRESGVEPNQRTGCGMHVNINVVDWTPQEKLLVQWCLNAFSATARAVGNRGPSQPDAPTFGLFMPVFKLVRQPGGALEVVTYPGGKHCAAWLRSPGAGFPSGKGGALVMEVRFPRSTLEIGDLRAAIDYVIAVRDWVRAAPNHTQAAAFLATHTRQGAALLEGNFLQWATKYKKNVPIPPNMQVKKATRLEVAQNGYEEGIVVGHPANVRSTQAGDAQQILRISTLLGKGARLEGESVPGTSIIDPISVRAGR